MREKDQTPMNTPLIDISNLNKWYDDFHVLKDINLTVQSGEKIVICGPSGSGKSTLVRCFSRLHEITGGTIEVEGKDIMSLSEKELIDLRRNKMGMVFQSFGLLPHRTVMQNAQMPLSIRDMPQDQIDADARKWLARVGLDGFEDRFPAQLSGGMQERGSVCRALINEREILLLDEPFVSLDPALVDDMMNLFVQLRDAHNLATVLVTHVEDEARRLADRVVRLAGSPATAISAAS